MSHGSAISHTSVTPILHHHTFNPHHLSLHQEQRGNYCKKSCGILSLCTSSVGKQKFFQNILFTNKASAHKPQASQFEEHALLVWGKSSLTLTS
jgi:hypothetical protein